MMILSIVSLIAAIVAIFYSLAGLSAICIALAFIFWFGAVMTPDEEKYVRKFRRNHRKR